MNNLSKGNLAERGFSLIELMVAMAIGLVMLIAVSYFLLGSIQSGRSHDDSSRMQENARNVLDTMGKAIRQAGYQADYGSSAALPDALKGTDTSITVKYQAQVGGENDCTGTNVAVNNVLTFGFSVNAAGELVCNNGTTSVVLADHVESLKITYGIDPGNAITGYPSGVIASYSAAALVADFTRVAVVKLTLTMRGTNANAATGGDGYLRQTYSASYTVRNQAG